MRAFSLPANIYKRPVRNRWPSRFFTLAATVIVLFVHMVWLFIGAVITPEPVDSPRSRTHVFSYTADGRLPSGSDIQLVNSPVLMSLPTRVGFSGPLLGQAQLDQLPAFKPESREFFQTARPFESGAFGRSVRGLDAMVLEPRLEYVPGQTVAGEVTHTFRTRPAQTMTLYWMDDVSMKTLETGEAFSGGEWGDAPWEARAYVCLNDMNRAVRVLLEEPAPEAIINNELLRAIRAYTFESRPAGGCGRLMIRFVPRVRLAGEGD